MKKKRWMSRLIPSKCYWPEFLLKKANMKHYEKLYGHSFDYSSPEYFTEKLQSYRLLYRHPAFSQINDKYQFKGYIREKLGDGYTIPILAGPWSRVSEFRKSWEALPEEFVLKSTISGGGKNIRIIHHKSEEDPDEVCREVREWFKPRNTNLNTFSSGFYGLKPRVIAEKYMETISGQLIDYKIFCFGGKPFCIYTAMDHFPGEISKISFYDLDWNLMDVRYGKHENCPMEKPVHFEEMLSVAEKLSADFPFVRVDFFETPEKLYVAELTLYPGGGSTPYTPREFDRTMGRLFPDF